MDKFQNKKVIKIIIGLAVLFFFIYSILTNQEFIFNKLVPFIGGVALFGFIIYLMYLEEKKKKLYRKTHPVNYDSDDDSEDYFERGYQEQQGRNLAMQEMYEERNQARAEARAYARAEKEREAFGRAAAINVFGYQPKRGKRRY